MAPDNECIGFYNIEIDEKELFDRVLDDISYDVGIRNLGNINRDIK
jgi:hypothetical protein